MKFKLALICYRNPLRAEKGVFLVLPMTFAYFGVFLS